MTPLPQALSFIGIVIVNPDDIRKDCEYILECPVDARILSCGQLDGRIALWLASPYSGMFRTEKRRLFIAPGGHPIKLRLDMVSYVGTVITPLGGEGAQAQDWHVFTDVSGDPVDKTATHQYTMH
jgi:hypothetical protein